MISFYYPWVALHVWYLQADMEEAKTQENKKLQLQLQELQLQLKDTKDMLKREHETAKEASEKAAAVPEILADTARVNELTSENERLKVSTWQQNFKDGVCATLVVFVASVELMICFSFYLQILLASFEEKLHKTEQKFEETEKAREELLNKATDAESKINEMKNTMQRFLWCHMKLLILSVKLSDVTCCKFCHD